MATYEGGTGLWLDFLTDLVPANFLGLFVSDSGLSFSVLHIVVVALAIGAASQKAGDKAEPFVGFMRLALAVIQEVLLVDRQSGAAGHARPVPLTRRVTTRNLGLPMEYASFAVPFGATTKMDGCAAIYPALAAITVAEIFGVARPS